MTAAGPLAPLALARVRQPGSRRTRARALPFGRPRPTRLHAELVALRIGEDHPADPGAAGAGDAGAKRGQPGDLLILGPVGGRQIQVHPVFPGLALRDFDEVEGRPAGGPGCHGILPGLVWLADLPRSEEHTSELQSL